MTPCIRPEIGQARRKACGLVAAALAACCLLFLFADLSRADSTPVVCDTPTSRGATVDAAARCALFAHYTPDGQAPDSRVVKHLQLTGGQTARSIAVVVGISNYDNKSYSIPAAHVDVVNLTSFLVDRQKFDEVIVLEDKNATADNIRYFLRKYSLDRTNFYQGKVRFLFTYSGHGVPIQFFGDGQQQSSRTPSVGLALAAAKDDGDYDNIYGLNELSALFNDLAKNTYHFLALINACFGGDVFGMEMAGGNPNALNLRGARAITAGPDDKEVYSIANDQGSLFFHTIIGGVDSGDADLEAQRDTVKQDTSSDFFGVVRLGSLNDYVITQITRVLKSGQLSAAELQGNLDPWVGSVEPFNVRANGGFFFFQNPPNKLAKTAFQSDNHVGAVFAPSLNQIAAAPANKLDDGFESLRAKAPPVRGVDISHYDGEVDWAKVAAQNVSFAYIKATQSAAFVDPNFSANWRNAQKAGVRRGAYHFFSFCTKPEDQFENLKRTVGPPDPSALPVAVDVGLVENQEASNIPSLGTEGKCAAALGQSGIQENLKSLLGLIAKTYGKRPVIYGKDYVLDKVLTAEFTKDFSLWRAKYGLASQSPAPPWVIWQFTANERVAGIKGPVDMNVLASVGH